jgi:hypothetical protein
MYSEIYLPVRLNGHWLLLICAPYDKHTYTVVFGPWDWENPDVIRVLEKLAEKLKSLILKDNLPIVGQKYDAQKTPLYPLLRESKITNRHGIPRYAMWKFYCPSEPISEIRPIERLMACWSLMI